VLSFLSALGVVALFVAGACADESGPAAVTLAELVAGQEDYSGRLVETRGVVRGFGEAEGATTPHYVVEDEIANRVALRPTDVAGPYAGQDVVVVGSFRYSEREGRSIEIKRIEAP
jgi:hypothetical protein